MIKLKLFGVRHGLVMVRWINKPTYHWVPSVCFKRFAYKKHEKQRLWKLSDWKTIKLYLCVIYIYRDSSIYMNFMLSKSDLPWTHWSRCLSLFVKSARRGKFGTSESISWPKSVPQKGTGYIWCSVIILYPICNICIYIDLLNTVGHTLSMMLYCACMMIYNGIIILNI